MSASGSADPARNRGAITACVSLATLMQALDSTIANVALPHIQGSISASQDQVAWVLTSYIAAAAIMTPPTGYLAARFGTRQVFLIAVAGFTGASMLCGIAQSLPEIVIFRLLQGVFGAPLVPLSQAVLLGIYPKERQGFAMSLFGMAVMAGPILGPVIGGWLTEDYSWRFVFYINLPVGVLAFVGMMFFLPSGQQSAGQKLDWLGFGSLSVAICAFQVLLDRGEQLDWFGSSEIWIEAVIAAGSFYIFLVHTFTSDKPFVNPRLFLNRSFVAGTLIIFTVGLTYYASLALQPPYLQTLMNYPVVTAGLVLGPRGVGTMLAMLIAGRLTGPVDTRLLLAVGLGLTAWAFYAMTGWTPDISEITIVLVGFIQGVGLGFLFVPLSAVTFATLSPEQRTEGSGIYNLSRNIGSSVGISVVNALLTTNTQVNHADIATSVTSVNRAFEAQTVTQFLSPLTAAGRAALDQLVTQQAVIISYIDDYKLLLVSTLAVAPLVFLFGKNNSTPDHTMALE